MRTEDAIDKLCDIAPIIADIGEKAKNDKEFKDFLASYNKSRDNRMFVLRVLPVLVKNYKEDMYTIRRTPRGVRGLKLWRCQLTSSCKLVAPRAGCVD